MKEQSSFLLVELPDGDLERGEVRPVERVLGPALRHHADELVVGGLLAVHGLVERGPQQRAARTTSAARGLGRRGDGAGGGDGGGAEERRPAVAQRARAATHALDDV